MTFSLLLADDVTPATGLTFGPVDGGQESAEQEFHLWRNKGTAGGWDRDLRLQLEVDDGSGTYVTTGLPAVDQHWFKARVAGGDNHANEPAFVARASDWFDLGNGADLPLPDVAGDTAVYLKIKLRSPGAAITTLKNFRFVVHSAEGVYYIYGSISGGGQGILTGIGDTTAFEFVDAPALAQTGMPDDYVQLSLRRFVLAGVYYTRPAESHQLNQSDSAAAALASGQAYLVTVSQGSGATATHTKGLKATAALAVAPTAPAGELVIGTVKVRYNAVLTNIITSDLQLVCVSGLFKPEIGSGLNVTVNPGRARVAGAPVSRTSQQAALCVASTTNYVWLASSGGAIVNQSATPPQTGLLLIASAVTSGSAVTTLTDLRTILRPDEAFNVPRPSVLGSATPRLLQRHESGTRWTNEGATAKAYFTLPPAETGLRFSFYVQDADGLRATAGTGDTIRLGGSVSATAGYAESTTIGDYMELVAINATEWCGWPFAGTFTVT